MTRVPQHSVKYLDGPQLLVINVNLPHCPDRLITIEQIEGGVRVSTPRFSIKWLVEARFPENVEAHVDSMERKFNGNLLVLTYKANKKGETLRPYEERREAIEAERRQREKEREQKRLQEQQRMAARIAQLNAEAGIVVEAPAEPVKQAPAKQAVQQPAEPKEQRAEKQEPAKILTAKDKLMQLPLQPKAAKVVATEKKMNNQVTRKQTRIVSNILKEKRVASEGDLMLKLARQAQVKQSAKEAGRVEFIEKKERLVMEQIEAKQKRRDAKKQKHDAIVSRIKDKQEGKK